MATPPIRGGSLSEAEVTTVPRVAWRAPAERSESPLVQGLRRLRRSGTAQYSPWMPDFKTTWTNTFDWYGTHSFQRMIPPETFWSYFEKAAQVERQFFAPGVVRARKIA